MFANHITTLCILTIEFFLYRLSAGSSLLCYTGSESNGIKSVKCDSNVTHCYYTRTLEKDTSLKFDHHNSKPVYNRSCDVNDICKNLNKTEENKIIEIPHEGNEITQHYCCSTSNCNVPMVPSVPKKCYNALHKGNISEGLKETCEHENSHCISVTIPMGGDDFMQYYSCEQDIPNVTTCDGVKNETLRCHNITYRGLKSTFCCCYGDFCVLPEFNYTESVDKISITNDTFIRIDGNPPRPQANPAYTDWLFNGGLIAAGVLIIVIIIGSFIIAMKCKKKKETNRMTLAYRRIAADSTPDDEEDIKMLLG